MNDDDTFASMNENEKLLKEAMMIKFILMRCFLHQQMFLKHIGLSWDDFLILCSIKIFMCEQQTSKKCVNMIGNHHKGEFYVLIKDSHYK